MHVTSDGASYSDVLGYVALLDPKVIRDITLSHYLPATFRDHVVPKQTMLDALNGHSHELETALSPDRFNCQETTITLQFQGLQGSEAWWEEKVNSILPKLHVVRGGKQYLSVKNVTCKSCYRRFGTRC